jgi:hypothetical protein
LPGPVLRPLLLQLLKLLLHVGYKVLGLVEVFRAEGVVFYELDIVVFCDVSLAVVSE